MSADLVNTLRVGGAVRAGSGSGTPLVFRAQLLDAWDAVRVEAADGTSVQEVKIAALRALDPTASVVDDYVVKLGGFEVLDEGASLATVGVTNGSILSIGHRFRRPVR